MQTRSQIRAMDVGQRYVYEQQFKAQFEIIDQPIKYTLLDGREFTYDCDYCTWIDRRDGWRKYALPHDVWEFAFDIAQKTGIPEADQILFNADTGARLNDDYYNTLIRWWGGDIPRDLANVLVMSK